MEEEYAFTCPYCWEPITMLLDTSVEEEQAYVEDCEVCCRPILVRFRAEEGIVVAFEAEATQS